ncbi:MAG: 30S ribosomal protein S9 [Candidatus Marsarchaeota archaeon]|nr:30S ribosomal protein S9 [Candidatus Marsarchaeota archaeon]MCL5105909.1 30S ribosomal protein S9 [Candidatus Marsarchaeota archaeon]
MDETTTNNEAKKPAPRKTRKQAPKAPSQKAKKTNAKSITVIATGRRKSAVARASVSNGDGTILINNKNLELIEPKELRSIIMEPFSISPTAAQIQDKVSIKVNVFGGGMSSQAQASRNSISKAMIAFVNNDSIRNEFNDYRYMIADDPRRVESKKFKGPKARARFQTSYR